MNRPINPPAIRPPFARYSHGIVIPAGARSSSRPASSGSAPTSACPTMSRRNACLCFENLAAILREAGMSFADVVRFTAYVTDRAYFPIYGAVRGRYVEADAFASTLVIVGGFTRPEFKIEVEVTAARVP
jgi:enamine deaminase RidA (YjgF/YER057c/UK114 family)